jgi:hypothetical protein
MHKKGDSPQVERFVSLFPKTTELIVKDLGETPFHVRGPLNTSVLDSVFCILAENLASAPSDLKERFDNLVKNKRFEVLTTTGTTDTNTVRERFKLVKKSLIGK